MSQVYLVPIMTDIPFIIGPPISYVTYDMLHIITYDMLDMSDIITYHNYDYIWYIVHII